ncbi:hypothetical protein SESBI_03866 [Sesbania bispinosa]|nr:hypothetical protein SESBI_03866 [Sesbania bispinosa]
MLGGAKGNRIDNLESKSYRRKWQRRNSGRRKQREEWIDGRSVAEARNSSFLGGRCVWLGEPGREVFQFEGGHGARTITGSDGSDGGKGLNMVPMVGILHSKSYLGGISNDSHKEFQPSMTQNPYELLLGLKQTTSVEDYREKFELYAGLLKGTDPDYLKGIFLNG